MKHNWAISTVSALLLLSGMFLVLLGGCDPKDNPLGLCVEGTTWRENCHDCACVNGAPVCTDETCNDDDDDDDDDDDEMLDGDTTDGDETDGDETDGDETDGDETDGDETDGDETDGDETDGDETDGDETDGDETDGDDTDGDDIDGDETDGDETDFCPTMCTLFEECFPPEYTPTDCVALCEQIGGENGVPPQCAACIHNYTDCDTFRQCAVWNDCFTAETSH